MADPVSQIGLVKAVLWEEAKGKLRAIVMADGQQAPQYEGPKGNHAPIEGSWVRIQRAVDKFIKDFEDEGYHE